MLKPGDRVVCPFNTAFGKDLSWVTDGQVGTVLGYTESGNPMVQWFDNPHDFWIHEASELVLEGTEVKFVRVDQVLTLRQFDQLLHILRASELECGEDLMDLLLGGVRPYLTDSE